MKIKPGTRLKFNESILCDWQLTIVRKTTIRATLFVHILPCMINDMRITGHLTMFNETRGSAGDVKRFIRHGTVSLALSYKNMIGKKEKGLVVQIDAPYINICCYILDSQVFSG